MRILPHTFLIDGKLSLAGKVRLLQHENGFPVPVLSHERQEIPGSGCVGVLGRKNENDKVALRDIVFRDRLMIANDGVRSRRIDNCDVPENRPGQAHTLPLIAQRCLRPLFAIDQFLNSGRAGVWCNLADILSEKGIDKAALSGLHLADNHEEGRRLQKRQPVPQDRRGPCFRALFRQRQASLDDIPQRVVLLLQFRSEDALNRHGLLLLPSQLALNIQFTIASGDPQNNFSTVTRSTRRTNLCP